MEKKFNKVQMVAGSIALLSVLLAAGICESNIAAAFVCLLITVICAFVFNAFDDEDKGE